MEEKKEAYEEAKRYINMAIEEMSYYKNDNKALGIWCDLIDVLDLIKDEINGIEDILERKADREREYMEREQNRVYRECQGF